MAKLESTAVNALISLRPLYRDASGVHADFDAVDLFREPKKPAPKSALAPTPRVAAPIAQVPKPRRAAPVIARSPRRADPAPLAAPIPVPIPLARARSPRGTEPQAVVPPARILTERVPRRRPQRIGYLAAITAIAVTSAAIAVAMRPHHAAAPVVAPAATAPVAAVTVPAVAPPRLQPQLVDVRFDSEPAGATVTLVDGTRSTVLGNTPLITAVDPSRAYEVAFEAADRPSRTERFDPKTNQRLVVVLPAPPPQPPIAAALPAPVPQRTARPAQLHRPVAAAKAGTGTLMISSKPPCAIAVDGRATGLLTPQRSISLAAGHHEITLVNQPSNIRTSFGVEIAAGQSARVIRDLMPR